MIATNRAKKGGQVGINGEFYEGGTFLPSTERPKSKPAKTTGKQEIEPYKWEVAPEGKASIYRKIVGIIGSVRNGVAELRKDDRLHATLSYYGITLTRAQELVDSYNAGNRWV
jgi:hypothetical protein